MEDPDSAAIRFAAFSWLQEQLSKDDTLPRSILQQGFEHQGTRVHLIGPQGIFKPAQIAYYPLSITTTANSPYNDSFDTKGDYLLYSYRGTDPEHHDNRRLRAAMCDRVPLIYFFGTVPGCYLVVMPVLVAGDDPGKLRFTVVADDHDLSASAVQDDSGGELIRSYRTRQVRQRIHQRSFRDRVLRAYRERCSVCKLRHPQLLDAAHIIPDSEEGEPVVSNGLSLCKIHHAAFDSNYFGIRPDHRIVVHPDIMEEEDGPMLKHGLQEINDLKLIVPGQVRSQPDTERLQKRFDSFSEFAGL